MQRLINEILERAKADRQRIVLPEGTEERTLKAANQILTEIGRASCRERV